MNRLKCSGNLLAGPQQPGVRHRSGRTAPARGQPRHYWRGRMPRAARKPNYMHRLSGGAPAITGGAGTVRTHMLRRLVDVVSMT